MKTILRITVLSILLFVLGCKKDDNEPVIAEVVKSDAKAITSFAFNAADNAAFDENLSSTVTEGSKTVSVNVPSETDITALTPTIQVSDKAIVSPSGAQDFRSPVTYAVTAEDGSTAAYRASILIMESNAKQIVSFVFTQDSNEVLNEDIGGEIEETERTIVLTVPGGTDLKALLPTVEIPENANIEPSGAQDFSSPVTYTVTAEDGTTIEYVVAITVFEIPNSAPLSFELIAPTVNGSNAFITVTPTFIWNASEDPDGDAVTYDLYLDSGATADQIYAENLTETTFEVTERLALLQEYIWRVVAKDPEGATVSSDSHSFSTRSILFNDNTVTVNADFDDRSGHTSVVFDDKFWVIGGSRKNDVWNSEDGKSWSLATDAAQFSERSGHTSIVFDNRLWVIGGIDRLNNRLNDVWFSEDGVTWSEATSTAPFSPRYLHTSVVFNNKLWLIGGFDGERKNDIWSSEDGINWIAVTNAATFTGRQDHSSVVFDNKLWVIGGFDNQRKNDVWSSADGITWLEVTNESTFTVRANHTSVVFDNKLWVIGGRDGSVDFKNDVWFSKNGDSWSEATSSAPFSARSEHTSVVFNNRVWIIGGFDGDSINNEVWAFD